MTRPVLIGAPVDSSQRQPGCLMGPAAYRVAGIGGLLQSLGLSVTDHGDLALPNTLPKTDCANPAVDPLAATLAWTALIRDAVGQTLDQGGMPVVLGGIMRWRLGRWPGRRTMRPARGSTAFRLFPRRSRRTASACSVSAASIPPNTAHWRRATSP